jgi:CheY-like chemotaxis protein
MSLANLVLIIDDDTFARDLLSRSLRDGCAIAAAAGGVRRLIAR